MSVGTQASRRKPLPKYNYDRVVEVCKDLKQRFEAKPHRTAAEAQALVYRIHDIAAECGCGTGKWLLFSSEEAADHAWPQIAARTYSGDLGSISTKICRTEGKARFVTCVYHHNFNDRESVGQLLLNLQRLGIDPGYTHNMHFKADIMTACRIYSDWWPGVNFCRWSARYTQCTLHISSTGHACLVLVHLLHI